MGEKPTYVLDETIFVNSLLGDEQVARRIRGSRVVTSLELLDEIRERASRGDPAALAGLIEMYKLRQMEERGEVAEFKVVPTGQPGLAGLVYLSEKLGGVLLTGDSLRALSLKIQGVRVIGVTPSGRMSIEEFFDEHTMSVHLKEGAPPMAKKGRPGEFKLVEIREEPLDPDELRRMAYEILERAKLDPAAFVEIGREGAWVVQIGSYRILVAFPPFSDGIEITAVRPLVKVTLEDYELSGKLKERLRERAEGILVAGPPGAGKTTFASALAEYYSSLGRVVKTLESPRDLQVGPEITQYGRLDGSFENTADLLLLVRPDYVIFDEMRRTGDFQIFVDMRLAGIGMVGVVHCGAPIEAIQRFLGRVDLGLLPHVVDTVVFIRGGRIEKVLSLRITVKLPAGMQDASLARPVVVVSDFETGRPEYEIYTFGDEVVVMPLSRGLPPAHPRERAPPGIRYRLRKRRHSIVLDLGPEHGDAAVTLLDGSRELITLTTDRKGKITLARRSPLGRAIQEAVERGRLRIVEAESRGSPSS
ncbi:MAG: ATPase [Thermoproteota archaeon]|nr:MAG: ATPase [Candidatus Korarchaeota archaeon]